ncbi:MAG: hypothetical protein NVS2B7_24210 [Herpetosiphon sp.]
MSQLLREYECWLHLLYRLQIPIGRTNTRSDLRAASSDRDLQCSNVPGSGLPAWPYALLYPLENDQPPLCDYACGVRGTRC